MFKGQARGNFPVKMCFSVTIVLVWCVLGSEALNAEATRSCWLQKSAKIANYAKTEFDVHLRHLRTLKLKGIIILTIRSAFGVKGLILFLSSRENVEKNLTAWQTNIKMRICF
jgi:hypothetical protein